MCCGSCEVFAAMCSRQVVVGGALICIECNSALVQSGSLCFDFLIFGCLDVGKRTDHNCVIFSIACNLVLARTGSPYFGLVVCRSVRNFELGICSIVWREIHRWSGWCCDLTSIHVHENIGNWCSALSCFPKILLMYFVDKAEIELSKRISHTCNHCMGDKM